MGTDAIILSERGTLAIITAHLHVNIMARHPIGEWKRRFRERVPQNMRQSVSMSYKLYCSSNGPVHYVGRSDRGLIGRINSHTTHNGDRCDHNCTHVEFRVIRNSPGMRDRKKKAFTSESRAYHQHATNCNDRAKAARDRISVNQRLLYDSPIRDST